MFGKKDKEADVEFFTVFDSKAKCYTEPFPGINREVVMRDFLNEFRACAVNPDKASKNRYYGNAEDFALFKIGSFDLKTGNLEAQTAERIAYLHELRALAQPSQNPGALLPT